MGIAVGSSADIASAPSASSMRSRASSTSQLDGSRNDCSLTRPSASAASQALGVPPAMANSCGFCGRPTVTPAVTPAANASNVARASGDWTASWACAERRKPMRRLARSATSATGPTHSASRPRASRHMTSSCPARSCPWQNPSAKCASASLSAAMCGTPHWSRRTVTGADGPRSAARRT